MGVATPGVLGIKRSLGKGLLEHDEWLALSVAEKGGTRMDIVAAGSAGACSRCAPTCVSSSLPSSTRRRIR
mgnify:CR=1 FL=1